MMGEIESPLVGGRSGFSGSEVSIPRMSAGGADQKAGAQALLAGIIAKQGLGQGTAADVAGADE